MSSKREIIRGLICGIIGTSLAINIISFSGMRNNFVFVGVFGIIYTFILINKSYQVVKK